MLKNNDVHRSCLFLFLILIYHLFTISIFHSASNRLQWIHVNVDHRTMWKKNKTKKNETNFDRNRSCSMNIQYESIAFLSNLTDVYWWRQWRCRYISFDGFVRHSSNLDDLLMSTRLIHDQLVTSKTAI
jgi:hypothetical protein